MILLKYFRITIISIFILSVLLVQARDFTYDNIIYTVLDEDSKTCETKSGDFYTPVQNVTGDVTIPAVVTDGKCEYSVTKISSWATCF